MCLTCGCGRPEDEHDHAHDHGDHTHHHHHQHVGPRLIKLEQDLLSLNDHYAQHVRDDLAARRILGLNLVSSPGSGKTTLLVRTVQALMDRVPVAVIEGDQQTERDADRIRATGAPAVQIQTGKGCHLEAKSVRKALGELELADNGVLFIENVGNLVCPALFDLGEAHKVAILSVPEGDDKPLKYPHMFAAADLVLINKADLLPYVDFDVAACTERCRRIKPGIEVMILSATTGEGLQTWLDWILARSGPALRSAIDRSAD